MLSTLLLSFLASAPQEFLNALWPVRDVGEFESVQGLDLEGDRLAVVSDRRASENVFVRVYRREGANWLEDGRLSDQPRQPFVFTRFGRTLDVDGERVAVGALGVVHVFERRGPYRWVDEELLPPRLTLPDPTRFGGVVALDGEWLAVGTDTSQPFQRNSIFLFRRVGATWHFEQRLQDLSGVSMELAGERLLVVTNSGVSLFERVNDAWELALGLTYEPLTTVRADLAGDDLAVLGSSVFGGLNLLSLYRREPSGWQLADETSLPGPGTSQNLAFTGTHAFVCSELSRASESSVEVVERMASGWGPATELAHPEFPARRELGAFMAADEHQVVLCARAEPTEKIRDALATYAVDGTRATLLVDHAKMALEEGGTLTLTLDAGVEHAGERYFFGGSLAGTSPGTNVLGVHVPLQERGDPYLPRSRRTGQLDGAGRATITIEIPRVLPGEPLAFLKDRTLHHVFLTWKRGKGLDLVSNVALTSLVSRIR